ncbi:MAG: IclR family transcriptional regulator [Candidatus Limnocylindrales bacterium]
MTARDRPPEEAAEDTSFARGLRLLLTVADRGEIRADELGALLDTPVTTVYRYLKTLVEFGFIERRGGRYRLGPRLVIGSGSQVSSERLIRLAEPVLRMIVDETGETAVVMRRLGLSAVCLRQVESPQPLRVALEPGSMTPLHAGAMSRVLLAFAPPEILDEVLAAGLTPVTRDTPAETLLRDALAEIVATGSATSEGELVPGSVAVAVPVFQEGGIVGSVAAIGPAARCGLAWRTRTRRLLETAAASISSALTVDHPR